MKPNGYTAVAFNFAQPKLLVSGAVLLGAMAAAVFYAIFGSLGDAVVAGALGVVIAAIVLEAFVVTVVRDLKNAVRKKPSLRIVLNYSDQKAKARILKILSERSAEFFDAEEKIAGTQRKILEALGERQLGTLLVCTKPFAAVRADTGEQCAVSIFLDESDSDSLTLAEVLKAKLEFA